MISNGQMNKTQKVGVEYLRQGTIGEKSEQDSIRFQFLFEV